MDINENLRTIPQISKILNNDKIKNLNLPHFYKKKIINDYISDLRNKIILNQLEKDLNFDIIINDIFLLLKNKNFPKLKKIINGTGIIAHTNIGRAPLSRQAIKNIKKNAEYSNIEFDIDNLCRSERNEIISDLLAELTSCEGCLIVNNNAAAVFLILNTFCKNKEVIISRSEMIEIGGSFRIPDIIKESGAIIYEVGTTNKTYLRDYENAINNNSAMIIKIHESNYRILGFTHSVDRKELINLAKEKNLIYYEDLGSGCFIDLKKIGIIDEPTVNEIMRINPDLLSFSGDKLLGGPQCGIIIGKKKYIDILKKSPLYRILRVDKLIFSALEATLLLYLEKKEKAMIPVLKYLFQNDKKILKKAEYLIKNIKNNKLICKLIETEAYFGSGAIPIKKLKSYGISINHKEINVNELAKYLATLNPALLGKIQNDELIIDCIALSYKDLNIIVKYLNDISKI